MAKSYYSDIDLFEVEDNAPNPVGKGIAEYDIYYTGSTRVISGREKIEQSMRQILDTPRGTRFFLPRFGSRLHELIGEPNDFIAKDLAELFVKEAIEEWEPRVVLVDVIAVADSRETVLPIEIKYHMKDSNDVQSYIYSLNREIPEMR